MIKPRLSHFGGRAVVLSAVLLSAVSLGGATAGSASASQSTTGFSARPACSDSYVVESEPLYSTSTGQRLWSYGYVQLWYNACNGDNWARLVSLESGTTSELAIAYNTAGRFSAFYCGPGTVNISPSIYSPAYNAGAWGQVVANGVIYYAEADQSGASFAKDVPDGFATCE